MTSTRPAESKFRFGRGLQIAVLFVPAVVVYSILIRYYTPVPIIDDYWHIFSFVLAYQATPSFAGRLHQLLFTELNSYKLLFDHALVVLQLQLFHRLNFPVLILLGNLTLIPLCGLFAIRLSAEHAVARRNPIVLLPVCLLVFCLNYAETVDWAISGIQQPMVVLFSIAAIYFLTDRERRIHAFALAILFAMLASATYANGMLLWPLGLLALWLCNRRRRRLLAWCMAAASTSAWYLFHYSAAGLVARSSLFGKFIFLLMFLGGGWENMHHRPIPYISAVIGFGAFAVFLHSAFTRYYRRSPFFFFSAVWILLTAMAVANARIAMGMQLSLSSRYKIYCDLFLLCLYPYLLDRIEHSTSARRLTGSRGLTRFIAGAVVITAVLSAGADLAGAKFLATRKGRAEAAMRRYLADPTSGSPMFLVDDPLSPDELHQEDLARQELNRAIADGIYTPPHL